MAKEKMRTITLTMREHDYQTIMKACRVHGHMGETLLAEMSTKDASGTETPNSLISDSYWHPIAAVCHDYTLFMSCALFSARQGRTPSADSLLLAMAELEPKKN